MEALVIALIATGNVYRQQKVRVPEPAKVEAFDLQALRLPDQKQARFSGQTIRWEAVVRTSDRDLNSLFMNHNKILVPPRLTWATHSIGEEYGF
jgi:hypothetical protein